MNRVAAATLTTTFLNGSHCRRRRQLICPTLETSTLPYVIIFRSSGFHRAIRRICANFAKNALRK
jgi:hypothetical protein